MKRLMILGAGIIQVPVIKRAKELSCHTIVVDFDKNALGIEYADEFFDISTIDKEAVLRLAREKQIDGILTTSDYPVNVVAYVCRILGLVGMSEEIARVCTNKYMQRCHFQALGIPVPWFRQVATINEARDLDMFPCIIKPIDSSASRGVRRVDSREELLSQFEETRSFSRSGHVIVEEFITGKEYSVETLSQQGRHHVVQVTEKRTIGESHGYFVEDAHVEPARLSASKRQEVACFIQDVLTRIGVDNCPTHTEIKINERGIFIIEMACRLGGDYITSDLVPLSTGVDMLGNLIRLSLGEKIDVVASREDVSAVQFLNTRNYERCLAFIEKGHPAIVRYEIFPYERHEIKNSSDRLGYIILSAKSQSEIDDVLLKIQ